MVHKTGNPSQIAPETVPDAAPARPVAVRDAKGRFPAGHSGNPLGRTKGAKNRITLARLMLEEVLRETLTTKGPELLEKALDMALEGNDKIMRVLLDKMLASPRGDDGTDARDTEVRVTVQNLTSGAPAATKVEAENVRISLPKGTLKPS